MLEKMTGVLPFILLGGWALVAMFFVVLLAAAAEGDRKLVRQVVRTRDAKAPARFSRQ
jgi:hypothetical protein